MLGRCTCATDHPDGLPKGTMERFDDATNAWQSLPVPVTGLGADSLNTGYDLGALPKGKVVTVRFRTSLATTMKAGTGEIWVAVAGQPGPYRIAHFEVPFTVRAA